MKQTFGFLMGVCVLIMGGLILWNLHSKVTIPSGNVVAAASKPAETHLESAQEAQGRQIETLTGPLADYMSNQDKPKATDRDAEPAQRPFNPADRVGGSPVGTSTPLLKKTFTVVKAVDLPFEVPPHAANPQLHGTYHSFVQRGGVRSSDKADVEFLLMNQRQYHDLLSGHPAEAQFSAEGAHNGEVNTNMPPSLDQPVKYYLVFRNDSRGPGKVFVQADFRVDF